MNLGIRAKAVLGLGGALLPTFVFLLVDFRSEVAWLERARLEQQLAAADAIGVTVDLQIDAAIEVAWAIAADTRIRNAPRADLDAHLAVLAARDPLVTSIGVYGSDGRNRGYGHSTRAPPEPRAYVGDRAYFLETLTRNEAVVSDIHDLRDTEEVGVVVSVPVRDDAGQAVGAVTVAADAVTFARPYESRLAQTGQSVILTDPHGHLAFYNGPLAVTAEQAERLRVYPPLVSALSGVPTTTRTPISEAFPEEKLAAFVRSSRHGWGVGVLVPRSLALAPIHDRQRDEIAVFLASSALSFGLVALVARVLVRPMQELEAAARALGAGDLSRRVAVKTRDEVGSVAASFNEMAERLEQRNAELERKKAEIGALNAELEARVQARTEELEGMNRELEAFSYSVSHDLRAPLRAVDGFVGAALQDFRDAMPPDAVTYLERAQAGARRMSRLIDGLLALSRAARTPLTRMWVDMNALAREVCDELAASAPGPVEVNVGQLPPAWGDPVLLRQALSNLVGNAIKYSRGRTPARIEVGYDAGPPGGWFVRDNGIGFDPGRADKLFQPFQRLDQPREFEGSGIGLAIVQRVIVRHGGKVWATATPGEGATFSFSIGGAPGT